MKRSLVSWQSADKPALILEHGDVISYTLLQHKVQSFAKYLPAGSLVFLMGGNDLSTIVCYLACLETGAVPLLLNKDISAEILEDFLRLYQPDYFFSPTDYTFDQSGVRIDWENNSYALYGYVSVSRQPLHPELALLLATSGSTGSPKLVRLSLENLRSNACSIIQYLAITEADRAITSLPFNYSFGMSVVNSHLMAGACLVLSGRSILDPLFWSAVKEHSVTSIAGVPYTYNVLLRLGLDKMDIPSVKTLTQAGGKLDLGRAGKVSEICAMRGIRFFMMYGQTEASPRMAYLDPEDNLRKCGSIGKAIPGGRLWLEGEAGEILTESDQVGELVYSGPNVCMGYAVTRGELALGDVNHGILHTGDLARIDDQGYFFITGRKNRFLKVFGIRLSLDAVEQILAHKGYACAAYGRDDLLVISIEHNGVIDTIPLVTELATTLAIHPTAVKIKVIPNLPRLSSGKLDYLCLNQQM